MSTDNDKDIRFRSTKGATSQPNGAITVESMYGPTIAKPRIEAKAITWAATADLSAIPKSNRQLARLFLYDCARRCNRYGNQADPNYVCFPSQRKGAKALDCTSDTFRKYSYLLHNYSLLDVTQRTGRGALGTNLFRLNLAINCAVKRESGVLARRTPSVLCGRTPNLVLPYDSLGHKGTLKTSKEQKKKRVKVADSLATGAQSANEGNGEEEKTSIDVQEFPAVATDCTMGDRAKKHFTSLISDHDITQKAQGQLGMYATKLHDLGLDWRAVMKLTLENWEVFRWYAENRGDEFKLPEHPSPARMLSNVNHSAQLYRDYLQDQIDDAEREATRARLREEYGIE